MREYKKITIRIYKDEVDMSLDRINGALVKDVFLKIQDKISTVKVLKSVGSDKVLATKKNKSAGTTLGELSLKTSKNMEGRLEDLKNIDDILRG